MYYSWVGASATTVATSDLPIFLHLQPSSSPGHCIEKRELYTLSRAIQDLPMFSRNEARTHTELAAQRRERGLQALEEPCRVDPVLSHSLVGPFEPFTVQGFGFSFRVVISAALSRGNDPFRQILSVSCAPPNAHVPNHLEYQGCYLSYDPKRGWGCIG